MTSTQRCGVYTELVFEWKDVTENGCAGSWGEGLTGARATHVGYGIALKGLRSTMFFQYEQLLLNPVGSGLHSRTQAL